MLVVLPARCRHSCRLSSHSRLEQHPGALQAPLLHMGSPQSSALCSPDPCIPSFAAQPSFALVHSECEASLVWSVAPTDTTTPGHQHFIPPYSSSVSPVVFLVKKAWGAGGHKRGMCPSTGDTSTHLCSHVKRLHPGVPRPPPFTPV